MARPSIPIRRKLSSITLTTCGIALLITAVLFLLGEFLVSRQSNLQQLKTLSEAIASNSTAALAFTNPDDAASVLSAFRSDPNVDQAVLYSASGDLFASFPQTAPPATLPASP